MRKRYSCVLISLALGMSLSISGCSQKTENVEMTNKSDTSSVVSDTTKGEADTTTEDTSATTEVSSTETQAVKSSVREKIVRDFSANGKVSSITVYEYDLSGNVTREALYHNDNEYGLDKPYEAFEREYDSDGNLVKENHFNTKGVNYECTEWLFDSNGNCVRKERTNLLKKSTSELVDWEYDANGNKIVEQNAVPSPFRVEYEYDAVGNNTKETRYMKDGTMLRYYLYEYDENGLMTKQQHWFPDGRLVEWYEWKYDSNGKKIMEVYSSHTEGALSWEEYRKEWEYNADGRKTHMTEYNKAEGGEILNTYNWTYECDGNGTVTKVTEDVNGRVTWTEYEYVYFDS